MKTYRDMIAAGYHEGRTTYQRGYVSRRADINDQPVHETRRGELYVLAPCWTSTRYCYRVYLVK